MRGLHSTSWFAGAACVAGATILLGLGLHRSHPDEKAILTAEDEVYEAVVLDLVTPLYGQAKVSQLVFDETLRPEPSAGKDTGSCEETVRKQQRSESDAPPFDSFVDKIYRFSTPGETDNSGTEMVENFLEKACSSGRLSRTFHTDLPKTFVVGENVHFEGWPIDKRGSPSFEKLFPGASGIISFSRVGFDSNLYEAIVSTGFHCGGLCGTGWRYFLKKKQGKWEVAHRRLVWVS
jgi:hypothetical protein